MKIALNILIGRTADVLPSMIEYMHMKDKKPTYTLWNGSQLLKTYPHTREGYTAALEQAVEYGGYWLKIFSSRDDLVWSAKMAEEFEENEW